MNLYENSEELREVLTIAQNLPNAGGEIPEGYIKPEGTLPITENGTKDVTNYAEVDVNILIPTFETEEITIKPQKGSDIVKEPTKDGFSKVTVESIPDKYIDTSDATAGVYDIYKDKTAYVEGELVKGELVTASAVLTGSSPGCTSTKLRLECPFKPTHITALYLPAAYQANKVHAITAWLNGYYCATSLGSVSSGKYALYRSQFEIAEDNDYFYWDGTYVYLAAPNSSYPFATGSTYRLFAFK